MKKLKVAFLVDSQNVNYQIGELINFVEKNEHFEAPCLITGYKDSQINQNTIKFIFFNNGLIILFKRLFFSIVQKIIFLFELRIIKSEFPNFQQKTHLKQDIKKIHVEGLWSGKNTVLNLSKESIKKIKAMNLDLIIRAGSGIIKGEVLNASKFGILSLHHGDNRFFRGAPAGFWEVLNKEPSSGFIIQQLTEELDGGNVILRGNMPTRELWMMNNASIELKSYAFFKKVLKDLSRKGALNFEEEKVLYSNRIYKTNKDPFILLRYLTTTLFPYLYRKFIKLLSGNKVDRWSVAFYNTGGCEPPLFKYKEITNPPRRFLADPFIVNNNDNHFLFLEDYSFDDLKGRISAIQLNGNNYEHLGYVLEEDFHLSYPFIFQYEGSYFMVPETKAIKQIRLYKCIDFPYKWKLEKVLLDNVFASDTNIIFHNEQWFIVTNICSALGNDNISELHIFHSENLYGNWTDIKSGNPVIFDSTKARNAGLFYHKSKLFRLNQVSKIGSYGDYITVNQVTDLSKYSYSEKKLHDIKPNFFEDIIKTHHFHKNEVYSVIDFARKEKVRKILKEK